MNKNSFHMQLFSIDFIKENFYTRFYALKSSALNSKKATNHKISQKHDEIQKKNPISKLGALYLKMAQNVLVKYY